MTIHFVNPDLMMQLTPKVKAMLAIALAKKKGPQLDYSEVTNKFAKWGDALLSGEALTQADIDDLTNTTLLLIYDDLQARSALDEYVGEYLGASLK